MDEKEREKIGGEAPLKDWGKELPTPRGQSGDKPGKAGIEDREGRAPDLAGSKPVSK